MRDRTQRRVVGNEVGGEEEVEMKVGSEHGGMDRLEGLDSLALLNQRYACLGFHWFQKRFGDPGSLRAIEKTCMEV